MKCVVFFQFLFIAVQTQGSERSNIRVLWISIWLLDFGTVAKVCGFFFHFVSTCIKHDIVLLKFEILSNDSIRYEQLLKQTNAPDYLNIWWEEKFEDTKVVIRIRKLDFVLKPYSGLFWTATKPVEMYFHDRLFSIMLSLYFPFDGFKTVIKDMDWTLFSLCSFTFSIFFYLLFILLFLVHVSSLNSSNHKYPWYVEKNLLQTKSIFLTIGIRFFAVRFQENAIFQKGFLRRLWPQSETKL